MPPGLERPLPEPRDAPIEPATLHGVVRLNQNATRLHEIRDAALVEGDDPLQMVGEPEVIVGQPRDHLGVRLFQNVVAVEPPCPRRLGLVEHHHSRVVHRAGGLLRAVVAAVTDDEHRHGRVGLCQR